jgi:2-haloacid dehalogenase
MTAAPRRPKLVVFDIIETVMSLDVMRDRFEAAGLAPSAMEVWFLSSLRDAFAIALTGGFRPFAEIMVGSLGQTAPGLSKDEAAELVKGMAELRPHPDAAGAMAVLERSGLRIAALSNGAAATTRRLLAEAGLEHFFERVGSVDDVKVSKPKAEVYARLAADCGVAPGDACLVAAHAWDVHGAKSAGLMGAFVDRGARYPEAMLAPDLTASSLLEIAEALAALSDQNGMSSSMSE